MILDDNGRQTKGVRFEFWVGCKSAIDLKLESEDKNATGLQ